MVGVLLELLKQFVWGTASGKYFLGILTNLVVYFSN